MGKQITTITLGILMIAGAMAMYAGESMSFDTNMTNLVYTVNGNSSNLDGLNVSFHNGTVTISTPSNYKPDNFTLIFFDNVTHEVVKTIYRGGGGGGGSTRYVDRNVTAIQPVFYDRNITTEVEVDKIIDNTIVYENPFELWQVLLALVVGAFFGWLVLTLSKKNKDPEQSAEDIMEDVDKDYDEWRSNL